MNQPELKTTLLFGGSFDPPHLGHAEILKESILRLVPKQALIIPAFEAASVAKKSKLTHATYEDRKNMCGLVVADVKESLKLDSKDTELNCEILVSDIEKDLPVPNYTINTIKKLRELAPKESFCILIGQDQFLNFNEWKNAREILQLCDLVVVKRSGEQGELNNILSKQLSKLGLTVKSREGFSHELKETGKRITLIANEFSEAKSTKIRNDRKNQGQWLSPLVDSYIRENNLYD